MPGLHGVGQSRCRCRLVLVHLPNNDIPSPFDQQCALAVFTLLSEERVRYEVEEDVAEKPAGRECDHSVQG